METGKCFFSYARADSEFVLKLAEDLRSAGTNLWLDQLDIPAGARWDDTVEEALKAAPCLLVVLSRASVASNNVKDEISFGIENGNTIMPILYKDCDIPFRLKRLQYIDFRVDYDSGFKRLVQTLKPLDQLSTQQPVTPVTEPRRPSEKEETEEVSITPERAPQEPESKLKPGTGFRDKLKDGSQRPRNDVFLSYANADDELLGWVNEFAKVLSAFLAPRLGREAVVWFDKQSIGLTEDSDDVDEHAVNTSATMLCIVSPAYFASRRCMKELQTFMGKVNIADRRIFKVVKHPGGPLRNPLAELLGYRFSRLIPRMTQYVNSRRRKRGRSF
jgi:hypothetical protein